MTLMKLAPESVRLRRMAKAYAAGEMTEADYRAARRQVIDDFPMGAVADDDTRPRWSEEPTLRGSDVTGPAAPAVPAAVSRSRRGLWLVAGLGLLLAAALSWNDARASEVVPPVRERDSDPATSAGLPVKGVRVAWGDDGQPPGEADLEALQQRAEQALEAVRHRNLPLAHGFTRRELDEVGRLLQVLGAHGSGELDAADARDLSALIREQKQRRAVTVADLEEVAEAVQTELRAQGYFLAVGYVPAQRLEQGVARIDVLPGRLGEVAVEGGDPKPVSGAFAPLLGEPLTLAAVERRMNALNALPGVTAQASFGPGAGVGETRLRLDLLEQRDWVASVTADNHGESATGRERLGVTAAWLNPRDVGDRLTVGGLVSVNPANQRFGYLDYDMPLTAEYRLSARVGNNDFSADLPPDLDGGGWFFDLAARRNLAYTRERGLTLVWEAARQSLDWDDGVDQTVTLAGVGLAGHRVLDRPRIAADAALSLSAGRIGGDRFAGQDEHFWLLELDGRAWLPVSLPGLPGEQKLQAFVAGQWSDTLLPATRRFALGGAERARGYDRDVFLADRALLAGLEARVPLSLGELVVFSEVGYGDARGDGSAAGWARVADAGLGWDAPLAPALWSRLSWAVPFAARGSGPLDDDGSRIYWSLRYEH